MGKYGQVPGLSLSGYCLEVPVGEGSWPWPRLQLLFSLLLGVLVTGCPLFVIFLETDLFSFRRLEQRYSSFFFFLLFVFSYFFFLFCFLSPLSSSTLFTAPTCSHLLRKSCSFRLLGGSLFIFFCVLFAV